MPPHLWQVQEAKNRFSELLDEAVRHGPQVITRHGKKTAVVTSFEDYAKHGAPRKPLSRLFQDAPVGDADLRIERLRGRTRKPLEL